MSSSRAVDRTHASPDPGSVRKFGQEERLTVRLRQLIRNYPRGLGILKEFAQNADDAGATRLDVWIDRRTHPTERMPDPRMALLGGPALLIANDREFSEADLVAIQRIGESSKQASGPKTGRFGLGFNTAYNVTDHPSFVTGESVYCMDPHASAVTTDGRGASWPLHELWTTSPDWPALFTVAGLAQGATQHRGTIFRLPLRDAARAKASEISSTPFTIEALEELVAQVIRSGTSLLLFARHLLHFSVTEVTDQGIRRRFSLTTLNPSEVLAGRRPLLEASAGDLQQRLNRWKADPASMPKLSVWRQRFEIASDGAAAQETWQLAAGLAPGSAGRLIDLAVQMARIGEKALPWVGAAAPIDASRPARVQAIAGGLYCTLSLPLTVSLPVHVNGCFDLDDSRGHLTSRAKDNAAPHELRAEWNRALLSEGCASAWIALLKALVPDDPAGFHELWPDPGLPHDALMKALVDGFYALARTEPLIRTRQHGRIRWATAAELRILPESASPSLAAALLADGLALPEPPLPPGMRRGLAPTLLTPGDLRELLRETPEFGGPVADAPRASLRRPEWIEAMFAYCASDRQNDLRDLPLALTGAGTLRAFGPRSRKWIFMPARETQALLSRLPWLFLAPELARHVAPAPDADLHVMTADHVAGFLKHLVGEVPRDWQPDASEPPNSAWLAALFRYFAGHDLKPESLVKLRACALLPGHDGRLHPAASQPPVLAPAGAPKEVLRRLRELGVVLAAPPDAVVDAFQAVLQRHPQFAARVTPATVIGALASRLDAVARLERDAAIELLEWLARVELTSADLETLKTIPLLPTRAGLRRAKDRGVFLPAGFEVPALGTSVDLVDVPNTCRSLVARLGVEALHAPKFVAELLLPALPATTPDERAAIWSWLRDNLEPFLDRMERPAADRLRGRVAQAPAFPATDGELHAVAELYDPDSELVRDVLAARALLPDPSFVRRERPRWHRFLLSLGLAAAPRLQDVVDHLLALCDEGLAAAPAIHRVFEYLQKEWSALQGAVVRVADQRVSLATLLKRKAWLPPLLAHASSGFVAPETHLYRPQELYTDVELVGSQAPVCAWRVAADVADALGLRRIPPTSLVIAHFEHLLESVPTEDDPEALARHAVALNPIYQHLKRLAEPAKRPGAPVLSAEERSTLVRFRDRACLWDLERRRLWRPSEVFVEPVLCFEPLRTSLQLKVSSEVVLLLGGKQRPDANDFRDFLVALAAEVGSGTLSPPQRWQVLHALGHVVGASHLDAVPLLCTDDRLRPAPAVFIDDAPWLLERPDDLHYVSPEVPIAVLTALGVPRISQALTEQLQSIETRDVAPDTLAACEAVQARLRTPEFASGVQRLVRHLHGPASEPDLTFLTELRLTAVSRIRTRLVLRGKEVTCVDARHFFQTHDLTILLTGPLSSATQIEAPGRRPDQPR